MQKNYYTSFKPESLFWIGEKQAAELSMQLEIEQELDKGLPESFSTGEYHEKCEIVFQHFFDNYFGDGKSIYNESQMASVHAA